MGETQDFGRWGQPQPALEFGGRIPRVLAHEFGGRVPRLMPQQFGGKIPLVDQGWKSPGREIPPTSSHFLH